MTFLCYPRFLFFRGTHSTQHGGTLIALVLISMAWTFGLLWTISSNIQSHSHLTVGEKITTPMMQQEEEIFAAITETTDISISIGTSVQGQPLLLTVLGNGQAKVLLVGGIHGGYEANTTHLTLQLIEYLRSNPSEIDPDISLYIVPTMNPDGYEMFGPTGRVNANGVDLNRNWGCNWRAHSGSYWQVPYTAGGEPFSEPESIAIRDLILQHRFEAVVFYHSQGAYIFYGKCDETTYSKELARSVSRATGYNLSHPPKFSVTYYGLVTGESTDYVDGLGIPSIGIELSSRSPQQIDWARNLKGLKSIMSFAVESFREKDAHQIAMLSTITDSINVESNSTPISGSRVTSNVLGAEVSVSSAITESLNANRNNTSQLTGTSMFSASVPISVSMGSSITVESQQISETSEISREIVLLKVRSVKASASSPCSRDSRGEETCFYPDYSLDQAVGTAWRAPFPSDAWLDVTFDRYVTIDSLRISGGYDKIDPYDGTDRWCENFRPKDIAVLSGDTALARFTLTDVRNPQTIPLFSNTVDTLRISIESAYSPNANCEFRPFIAISNLVFYGSVP